MEFYTGENLCSKQVVLGCQIERDKTAVEQQYLMFHPIGFYPLVVQICAFRPASIILNTF